MDTLDDIRLKTADELTDEDKSVLKEKWDELTDEEKDAFKDTVTPEKKEEKEEKEEAFSFKSKEEFEEEVSKRIKQTIEEREKARKEEEEKKNKPDQERFFPEGYQAKDWNDAAERMYPKFRERFVKEQQEVSQKTQEALDKINAGFDEEIEGLSKADKTIPAKGTKEREAFETELFQIGVDYKGVTNMTEAYDLYKVKHGKTEKKEEEEEKEEVSTRQRDLASKVGKSGGEGTEIKARKYSEISRRSMDDLLEEDLAKMGVKS